MLRFINSNQVNILNSTEIQSEMASSTSGNQATVIRGYGLPDQSFKLHFSGEQGEFKQWQTRFRYHLLNKKTMRSTNC